MILTMFSAFEETLLGFAEHLPLPVFAAIASFLEEVIAPIPSGPVMLATGSLAALQDYTLIGLIGLATIAAIGKLGGALVVYRIADTAEDIFSSRFARSFGVSAQHIEKLGARLGNGLRDYVILTLLRALPIIPSVVLSVGGGVLKIPLRLFIVSTLIGSIIRDALFIYFGYVGLESTARFIEQLDSVESVVLYTSGAIVFAALVVGFAYAHSKRAR